MDNITHSLTGLALGRAGLNKLSTRPTLILLLASNLPDVDIVSAVGGGIRYLEYHRGITHSIAFMPVMAMITVLIMMAVQRSRESWIGSYVLALIGLASHLIFDWTTSYAVRLLLPFSNQWLSSDLNNIIDLWILAVLLLSLAGPLLGRLVSSEIGAKPGSGRGLAIFALSFILLYDFGRYMMHERALAVLNARIYDGSAPRRVAAFPNAANPMRWIAWVETDTFAERFELNLALGFDPGSGTKFYKPESSPAIEAAKGTEAFRVLGQFAIYPLLMVSPADEPEGAVRVELRDERFPFLATAIVDRSKRVIRSSFHF